MATPPASNQILKCIGELQIISPVSYDYAKGTIRFIGPYNSDLGQIRASGFGGFGVMIADVSGLSSGGFNIRTSTIQGDSSVGGSGQPYPFTVQSNRTTMVECVIGPRSNSNPTYTPVMTVQRPLSTTSTWNESNLATFSQNQIRSGEQLFINIKGGFNALQACLGAIYPGGDSSSSTTNRVFLGVRTSSSSDIIKALQMDKTGNVSIPARLDVGTISATSYLGLPTPDVTPITLDKTNNRVGINTSTPTVDLHVVGKGVFTTDIYTPSVNSQYLGVSSFAQFNTINATTYQNLPPPDVIPITLDKTNNRVGINKISPSEALDVVGSIRATGGVDAESITGNNTFFSGTMSAAAVDTGSVVSTGSIAGATGDFVGNVDVGGDLSVNGGVISAQLDVLGTITTGTINAGTYLNLPPTNVLPITLDTVNNRVGINKITPTQTLDVVGIVAADAFMAGENSFLGSGTTDPNGVTGAPPGSIWMRNDVANPTAYIKTTTTTTTTGWSPLTISPTTSQFTITNMPTSNTALSNTNVVQNILSFTVPSGIYSVTVSLNLYTPTTTLSGADRFLTYGLGYAADTTTPVGTINGIQYKTINLRAFPSTSFVFQDTLSFICSDPFTRTWYFNYKWAEAYVGVDNIKFLNTTGFYVCRLGNHIP